MRRRRRGAEVVIVVKKNLLVAKRANSCSVSKVEENGFDEFQGYGWKRTMVYVPLSVSIALRRWKFKTYV